MTLNDLKQIEARSKSKPGPIDKSKASVLAATGRTEPIKLTARSVAQILEGEKAFEQFRKLRTEL